jgi:hypothetical protein
MRVRQIGSNTSKKINKYLIFALMYPGILYS